jgi:hypothetical protein
MVNTVTRTRRVEVQRCAARTPPKHYRPDGGQCSYQAVVVLDGEPLCQIHADQWVRNEGFNAE